MSTTGIACVKQFSKQIGKLITKYPGSDESFQKLLNEFRNSNYIVRRQAINECKTMCNDWNFYSELCHIGAFQFGLMAGTDMICYMENVDAGMLPLIVCGNIVSVSIFYVLRRARIENDALCVKLDATIDELKYIHVTKVNRT